MNSVTDKGKLKIQPAIFFRNFLLWLLGIPINILPIVFKHLNATKDKGFPGISKFVEMTLSDFDVSFISLSVLFVLCIEGCFVDEEIEHKHRGLLLGTIACLAFMLVLFCTFSLRPDLFSLLNNTAKIVYNGIIAGFTVLLGLLCNLSISRKVVHSK